jgi:hypothetical protein
MTSALLLLSASACGIFKSRTDQDEDWLVEDLHEALQRHVRDVSAPRVSVDVGSDTIRCVVRGAFDALSQCCVDGVLALQMGGGYTVRVRVLNAARVVFGLSSRERVPCVDVAVPVFEPTVLSGGDWAKVVGPASLQLLCGSVLLYIRDSASDEHARAIADCIVGSQSVALDVERALGGTSGMVTFLAHNVAAVRPESPLELANLAVAYAKLVWLCDEQQPTDESGKALARSVDKAVQTLLGRRIFVFYTSERLGSRRETAPFKTAVRAWFQQQQHPQQHRYGALVCAAQTDDLLAEAWPIVEQVLVRAPRNDLPAIEHVARQVALDVTAPPNACWRCLMLGGSHIAREQLTVMCELVQRSPLLCVVDLTRVTCEAIDAAFVARLLVIDHVRFASIVGMAQCEAIRNAVGGELRAKLIWSEEATLDEAHRLFHDFRARTWEASRGMIATRLMASLVEDEEQLDE